MRDLIVIVENAGRLRLTDTPAFKRWFDGSKIVDSQGQPLKLYRGLYGPFVQSADHMEPRSGYASFFSTSPYVASSYANPATDFFANSPDNIGGVFPVYIKATRLREFPVRVSRDGDRSFDFFAFDRQAQALAPGEALVVRQVYDLGPRATTKFPPTKQWGSVSDIYAIGKGTSVKSAVSNTGRFTDSRVITESDLPGYWRDNPGGDWLTDHRADAEWGAANRSHPVSKKMLRGRTTAKVAVTLPTDWLSKIPGAMDERRAPGDRNYDHLVATVDTEGWNQTEAVVLVVNQRGQPFVYEGNTRIAVAVAKGIPTIKTEVQWLNGGEDEDGPATPAKIAAMTRTNLTEQVEDPGEAFIDAFYTAFETSDLKSAGRVALHQHALDEVEISYIEAHETGKGTGTRLMKLLTSLADEHGVVLYASPASDADGEDDTMDTHALAEWYERWGFERQPAVDAMRREPSE